MGSEVKYHLFSKLSEDTLCQCIYPYISRSQPRELLADIEQHSISLTDLHLRTFKFAQTMRKKEVQS